MSVGENAYLASLELLLRRSLALARSARLENFRTAVHRHAANAIEVNIPAALVKVSAAPVLLARLLHL